MSPALISYVWSAAIRDKLIISMLVILALSTSMSFFMASAAVTEQNQFTAVYMAGSLRIVSVLGLVLFTVFFIRRSFEAKEIEFLLSRPIGRVQFIISQAIALSMIAVTFSFACAAFLYFSSLGVNIEGFWMWTLSVALEAIIMVNIALFFAMFFSSSVSAVLAVMAFYALGRMIGQVLGILKNGTAGENFQGLEVTMQAISTITPRLDLLGQTSWLLYGVENYSDMVMAFIQIGAFIFLVVCAALIDLIVRQF